MHNTEWEAQGVRQHFHGPVTGAERLAGLNAMLDDARIARARYIIIDFTGMTGIEIAESEAETLLALMNSTLGHANPNVLLVYVISGEVANAYLHRVLRIGPLEHMRRVCDTLPEARAWIAATTPVPKPDACSEA